MEREARRKKISARGTDRMALITGRIQTLHPNLSRSSSFSDPTQYHLPAQHTRSASEPASDHDRPLFQHDDDDVPDNYKLLRYDNTEEVSRRNASKFSDDQNLREKPCEYHLGSITPKELNIGIISSEKTRVICSSAIALLVVLSHVNLPNNAVKSKRVIGYRPLYAVLLTDILIVAARVLALYSRGKEELDKIEGDYGNHDCGGTVNLLEWGLVLHQIFCAVFIDCSFYLSIVICGLSVV